MQIDDLNFNGSLHALKADAMQLAAFVSALKDPITADEAAQFAMLENRVNLTLESLACRLASQEGSTPTWN